MTLVRDARPPLVLIRMMNPILRVLLATRAGRFIRPLALIEFAGRRTGRRYRVPVGWHRAGEEEIVFTPAPWRINFAGGAAVMVHHLGRSQAMHATLDADPSSVARILKAFLDGGGSPRQIGLRIAKGHEITPAEVASVARAAIRFEQPALSSIAGRTP
jgi:hypothetical protein